MESTADEQDIESLDSRELAFVCFTGSLKIVTEETWRVTTRQRFPDVYPFLKRENIPDLEGNLRVNREFCPWRTLYTQIIAVTEGYETAEALKEIINSKHLNRRYTSQSYTVSLDALACLLEYDLLLATLAVSIRLAFKLLAVHNSTLIHNVIISDTELYYIAGEMLNHYPISSNYARRYGEWKKSQEGVLSRFLQNSIFDAATTEVLIQHRKLRKHDWSRLLVKVCAKGYVDTLKLFLRLGKTGKVIADPSLHKSRCLRVALIEGHREIVKLLLNDGRVMYSDITRGTFLHFKGGTKTINFAEIMASPEKVNRDFLEFILREDVTNRFYGYEMLSLPRELFMGGLRKYLQYLQI